MAKSLKLAQKSGFHWTTEEIQALLRRRMSGETLASIGRSYGISRERVRRLIGNTGRLADQKAADLQSDLTHELLLHIEKYFWLYRSPPPYRRKRHPHNK